MFSGQMSNSSTLQTLNLRFKLSKTTISSVLLVWVVKKCINAYKLFMFMYDIKNY